VCPRGYGSYFLAAPLDPPPHRYQLQMEMGLLLYTLIPRSIGAGENQVGIARVAVGLVGLEKSPTLVSFTHSPRHTFSHYGQTVES